MAQTRSKKATHFPVTLTARRVPSYVETLLILLDGFLRIKRGDGLRTGEGRGGMNCVALASFGEPFVTGKGCLGRCGHLPLAGHRGGVHVSKCSTSLVFHRRTRDLIGQ